MANIFPRSWNWLPLQILFCLAVTGAFVTLGVNYYFTPKYTRVGYMPQQPVSFSHYTHAEQIGIDCRYCHIGVEQGANSTIPPTSTCMNCHSQIQKGNPKLAKVYESWEKGKPIEWVRIHKAPDYVYFNHSVHVNRGISCYSCHNAINKMEVVYHGESQSMSWCLDCHRKPEANIRPLEQVYNLNWTAGSEKAQLEQGKKLVHDWGVKPPQNCSTCHR